MQEALKNPHYQKIWEKVIMNRHPKARSLEKALSLEMSPFNGCIVLIDLTELGYAMSSNEPLKVVSYNKFEYFAIEPVYSKLISVWDICNKKVKNNAQILGRPITLFDVLKLLQKNIENGEFALMTNCVVLCNIDVTRNTSNDIFQYFVKKICDINNKINLIEEQTPETWEKIANLI